LGRQHAGKAGWGWVRAAPLIGAGAPAAESKMRGFPAKRGLKSGLFLACVLTAGVSLAGCSGLDNMFDESSDISASDAATPTAANAAATPAPTAEAPPMAGGAAPVATITPVAIDPGSDTGTQVNKTIQTLRGQLSGLETKLGGNAQRLA